MPDAAIEIENLTKDYPFGFLHLKKKRSLEALTMQVESGEVFGFLGPNGAGKSTTIKLLVGLIFPEAGTARILGKSITDIEMHRGIGYLPEQPYFYDYLTAAEVLDYFARFHDLTAADRNDRVARMLKKVGLETARKIQLRKYSKGMLQRVGLAQALMHEPRLLILDEPTDGVDPIGRRQIRDILHTLEQQGVTIFVNSHLLGEVELFCRDVAIIHRGKVALQGKVKDLIAGSGYRLTVDYVPERLDQELRARAKAVAQHNGSIEFLFSSREEANQALDLLRGQFCEIEGLARTTSTLEEVFVRTVNES